MLGQHVRLRVPEKWRESPKRWTSWIIRSKINGGKIQLHVQQRKKEKGRKIRNYTHGSAEAKNGGKILRTRARGENGGKIRNNEPRISTKNKMAGKFNYTCNNGSKRNVRKIRNYMDQLKQKMAGKFYNTCVEGGKWRENPKPTASDGGNRGWLSMSCLNWPQVGQEVWRCGHWCR